MSTLPVAEHSCIILEIWVQKTSASQPAFIACIETRVALIQRSCGYALRPTLSIAAIHSAVEAIRACSPHCTVLVDNCYGEFTETQEPCHVSSARLSNPLSVTGHKSVHALYPLSSLTRGSKNMTRLGLGLLSAAWGKIIFSDMLRLQSQVCFLPVMPHNVL